MFSVAYNLKTIIPFHTVYISSTQNMSMKSLSQAQLAMMKLLG